MISLLVTARKDSKFLAKFVMTFISHTKRFDNVELLIFTPGGEWNKELLKFFTVMPVPIKVIDDETGLGRGGNHIFYQEAFKSAKGDWIWYLCDDHQLLDGYDQYITDYIKDLDPTKPVVIAPAVDNSGRISHILSRKFIDTVGFAPQGNVDSCINETLERLELLTGNTDILHLPLIPVLHDFSLDKDLFKSEPFDAEYEKALFKSQGLKDKLQADAEKLYLCLK